MASKPDMRGCGGSVRTSTPWRVPTMNRRAASASRQASGAQALARAAGGTPRRIAAAGANRAASRSRTRTGASDPSPATYRPIVPTSDAVSTASVVLPTPPANEMKQTRRRPRRRCGRPEESGSAGLGGGSSEPGGSAVSPATSRNRTGLSDIVLPSPGSAAASESEAASGTETAASWSVLGVAGRCGRSGASDGSDVAVAGSAVAALGTNQRRSLRANLTKRNSQRYPDRQQIENERDRGCRSGEAELRRRQSERDGIVADRVLRHLDLVVLFAHGALNGSGPLSTIGITPNGTKSMRSAHAAASPSMALVSPALGGLPATTCGMVWRLKRMKMIVQAKRTARSASISLSQALVNRSVAGIA